MIKLVASLALISCFFRKNLMIIRRKYSDILCRFPKGINRDYVLVARSIGVSGLKIMVRHILPNIIGPIIVFATLGVGTAILQEAGLSFLGVGVARPTASFGMMLAESRNLIRFAPLLCIFPGLGITFIVLALNTVGDGLRDAIDPKLKR